MVYTPKHEAKAGQLKWPKHDRKSSQLAPPPTGAIRRSRTAHVQVHGGGGWLGAGPQHGGERRDSVFSRVVSREVW